MFNGTPKKLIIVGDKDTDVYCEYLSMLISVVDDVSENDGDETKVIGITDGSVDTAIWTNEIYRDNRAHTSSRQKFIFIGNKGAAKNIIPNINFEQSSTNENSDMKDDVALGIYYGWFGNKACIYVDDKLTDDHNLYIKKFRDKYNDLLERYQEKVAAGVKKKQLNKKVLVGAAAAWAVTPLSVVGLLPLGVAAVVKGVKDANVTKQEILDQAYRYAILKFYLEYLEIFMG